MVLAHVPRDCRRELQLCQKVSKHHFSLFDKMNTTKLYLKGCILGWSFSLKLKTTKLDYVQCLREASRQFTDPRSKSGCEGDTDGGARVPKRDQFTVH